MVKTGKVEKGIKGTCDNKICNLGSLLDESFWIYYFSHPVSGKGKDIPQDDQPEKSFKLKPSRSGYAILDNPVKQVGHSGDEQDVSDLMRYQTFCSSMLLHGIYRHCQADHGKGKRKTKDLE